MDFGRNTKASHRNRRTPFVIKKRKRKKCIRTQSVPRSSKNNPRNAHKLHGTPEGCRPSEIEKKKEEMNQAGKVTLHQVSKSRNGRVHDAFSAGYPWALSLHRQHVGDSNAPWTFPRIPKELAAFSHGRGNPSRPWHTRKHILRRRCKEQHAHKNAKACYQVKSGDWKVHIDLGLSAEEGIVHDRLGHK